MGVIKKFGPQAGGAVLGMAVIDAVVSSAIPKYSGGLIGFGLRFVGAGVGLYAVSKLVK